MKKSVIKRYPGGVLKSSYSCYREDSESLAKFQALFGDFVVEVYSEFGDEGAFKQHPMSEARDHIVVFNNGNVVWLADALFGACEVVKDPDPICVTCGVLESEIIASGEDLSLVARVEFGGEVLCECCYSERLLTKEKEDATD